jgi:hypothetical protein
MFNPKDKAMQTKVTRVIRNVLTAAASGITFAAQAADGKLISPAQSLIRPVRLNPVRRIRPLTLGKSLKARSARPDLLLLQPASHYVEQFPRPLPLHLLSLMVLRTALTPVFLR